MRRMLGGNHLSRSLFCLFALLVAASCGGSQVRDGDAESGMMQHGLCTAALSPHLYKGRPVVQTECRFVTFTPAGYRRLYLVDLHRSGAALDEIDAHDIRATVEFRSYMESANVWQWGRRMSDAEALAACRLMLEDLRAGYRVNWRLQARAYLARARQARAAAAAAVRSGTGPGAGPGRSEPISRRTGTEPDGTPRPAGTVALDDVTRVGWECLWQLRREGGDSSVIRLLERLLDAADEHAGALTVILSGTTVVIAGVVLAGDVVMLDLTAAGAAPSDIELAMQLAEPLLQELGNDLRAINEIAEQAGTSPDHVSAPRLTVDEHLAYRELTHRPVAELGRGELERIHELQQRGGLPAVLRPGNPAHKAERWADYRRRGGKWSFARWSRTYDQNMVRSSQAHAVADRVHRQLGWGEREVRVRFEGLTRVLDIADRKNLRGVEIKSGYVTYTADIAREVTRDAKLVSKYNWSITWHVEGRFSEPLRKALRAVRIAISETRPNTPLKDLRP